MNVINIKYQYQCITTALVLSNEKGVNLFVEQRKPYMVFPHAVNFETAFGNSLRLKVQLFHNAQTFCIAGHNIAFDAVKLQNGEGKVDNLFYSFGGVTFALLVCRNLVGQIAAFYTAEQYIGDAYSADNFVAALFSYPKAELFTFAAGLVFVL